MPFNPTPMQAAAINAQGNILVAAAAGSGKTAVLVERVISKLCSKENPISADRLLIVTFTNAAAAEMRQRIELRLDEECRKNPDDSGLLVQKHLLSSAKICTIDSFCIDLVRENFERLQISPDFKISDGASLKSVDEKVISMIINRYLEQNDPVFSELLDIIGAEFDEKNFLEFVLAIYNYSRQLPFPRKWFISLSDFYNGGTFSESNLWAQYAFDLAEHTTEELSAAIMTAAELLTVSEKATDTYLPVFLSAKDSLNKLNAIAKAHNWDDLFVALNSFLVPSLPTGVRGLSGIPEVTAAKEIYSNIKKGLEKLSKLFYEDKTFINRQFARLYQPIKLLSDILIEFDDAVFEEYKQLNTFTFHNTEHMALNLLCSEQDGEVVLNPEAEELLSRFDEVMVDEYQDTNDLQDLIFKLLSDSERRLFAVGDVKQSIYGFRGANPKNFLLKKNRAINVTEADNEDAKKIILGNNFRCHPQSCEFINYFFELFMNSDTGDILYNDEEKLIPSAVYPKTDFAAVEFDIIDCADADEQAAVLQARRIAEYIRKTMGQGNIIRVDENTLRPAKYSDFTILLRSAKLKAPTIANELKNQGIPVSYTAESFTESIEIATFLNLLKVIDNPLSDIELLSVMKSPLFGFTSEELARMRLKNKDESLYSSVNTAAQGGSQKAENLLNKLSEYRLLSVSTPLPRFISELLHKTHYLDIVSSMNDGARRRSNLLLLCEFAKQFSAEGYVTPGSFSKHLLKQSENGFKAASVSDGEAVNIMSIHASKGLQFPICIIADLSANFNDSESKMQTIFSTDFGIGFKYYDEELKTKLTTLSREALLDRIRSQRLEEELRLIYVAMTRTQDRLVLISALNNAEKKIGELSSLLISTNGRINSYLLNKTKSYSDWLILAMLMHPDGRKLRGVGKCIIPKETSSNINLSLIDGCILVAEESKPQAVLPQVNSEVKDVILQNISFEYPYKEILGLQSKASVSKLANSAESAKYAFSAKPAFMSNGGITANERGIAMHKVMEFFDFEKFSEPEYEIERLYEWEFISLRERDSLDIDALKRFFASDIFARMRKSKMLKREMRFLTEIPASKIALDITNGLADENIIVQGAVDVCFVENDGIVILDFKTDRVNSPEALKVAYSEQLKIYADACAKIFDMPIKQKLIYSFSLGAEIEI